MSKYEVTQYETWTSSFIVDADSAAEAVRIVFSDEEYEKCKNDTDPNFLVIDNTIGTDVEGLDPDLVEELRRLKIIKPDDEFVPSLAEVKKVSD